MNMPANRRRRPLQLARSRIATPALVGGLTLVLSACADTPLSTFDAKSEIAQRLDNFLVALLVVCGVVYAIVQAVVLYMAKRFGVSAPENDDDVWPDDEFPDQTHGNTRLEVAWTMIPVAVMAVVAFFTMGLLFDLDEVEAQGDTRIQSVTVVGQQWWWEFQYHLDDDGVPDIVTAGELALPVGEEVRLNITSRDVIHSFWIPNLNGKRDAVPGRMNTWTIEAAETGRFHGECTEMCGLSHAYMEKWAIGLEPADWDTWAANQMQPAEMPEEGTAAYAGWETFNSQCASCHVVNGLTSRGDGTDDSSLYDGANKYIGADTLIAGAAPNLTHVATRSSFAGGVFDLYENPDSVAYLDLAADGDLNRGALENWVSNAPEMKPNYYAGLRGMPPFTLSAEDVDNLVEFLTSLD